MLNRLYIVVGILTILVLAGAFIVPHFVPWANYRGRMQELASKSLGAEVRINGEIRFVLLPQPHLSLGGVSVGPADHPVMSVKSAEADFSLLDFLRDRYLLTKLVLDHPVLNANLWNDGTITTGLKLPVSDGGGNIAIANATISVGRLVLTDASAGRVYALEGITGDLTLGSLNGPFAFTGGASFKDQHYGFHVTAAAFDTHHSGAVSLFAESDSKAFSVTADGTLSLGFTPHFAGNLAYRQSPPGPKDKSNIVGDLTFVSVVDATPAKIALPSFTLVPDENRAMARLSGTGSIEFGATPNFVAAISGGVLALPPRDATAEKGPQPYELVRLLAELPVVPMPPMAGTVTADIAELDLRAVSVRNMRLEASTDASTWTIKTLKGLLPGNTSLAVDGTVSAPKGRPSFAGNLRIGTSRLDTFAALWRKPAAGNPLFGLPGTLTTKVSLIGQTMALTDSTLTLGETDHRFTALVNFGPQRRLDLSAQFADLSADDSAALLALVPDVVQDPGATVTFPQGALSLTADSAAILGLAGKSLELEGKWGDGAVEISKLAAADLGGTQFDLSLALSGTPVAPRIAGDGTIKLAANGGPALDRLFDLLATPAQVRSFLGQSLPADLKVHLDDPGDSGGQGVALSGKAGVADLTLDAGFSGGLLQALSAPLKVNLELSSPDSRHLTAQLGLGDVSLLPETGPLKLAASVDGTPADGLKSQLSLTGGGDSIRFDGTLVPGDLTRIKGSGRLQLALSDSSVAAAAIGLAGLYTPPVAGTADLSFDGSRSIGLDNIAGTSGGTGFAGRLSLNGDAKGAAVAGSLTLDSVDVASLIAAAGSPTALMASAGKVWPDGPLSPGEAPRQATGTVTVETPAITLGQRPFLTDAGFEFNWDATRLGVHRLAGKLGGGSLTFDADVCCAGSAGDQQLTGNAALTGVSLASVLPPGAAATLSGTLDGSVRFTGSGDSIASLMASLGGDGSFSIADFKAQAFDPGVFAAIAAIADIVALDPKQLSAQVAAALGQGAFAVPSLSGGMTAGGGVLRVPNLAAATASTRLFGTATLNLSDLTLGGSFGLTPIGTLDKAGLVSESTAKITATLSGTLLKPARKLDIDSMVEALKVRAYEIEVARLEALKAQDDARAHAAANARKDAVEDAARREQDVMIAAQQAADAAAAQQAAAKKAADDAAAKQAADAAAAKKAADAAAAKKAAAARQAPLDLQMPTQPFFQPLN